MTAVLLDEQLNNDDITVARDELTDLADDLVRQIQNSGRFLTLNLRDRQIHARASLVRHVGVPMTEDPYFNKRFRPQDTFYRWTINRTSVSCQLHVGAYTNTDGLASLSFALEGFSFKNLTLQGLASVIKQLQEVLRKLSATESVP